MRTEHVTVEVRYSIPVEVADDATNEDILAAAEAEYVSGELGVLDDHTVDPDGEFSDTQVKKRPMVDIVDLMANSFQSGLAFGRKLGRKEAGL